MVGQVLPTGRGSGSCIWSPMDWYFILYRPSEPKRRLVAIEPNWGHICSVPELLLLLAVWRHESLFPLAPGKHPSDFKSWTRPMVLHFEYFSPSFPAALTRLNRWTAVAAASRRSELSEQTVALAVRAGHPCFLYHIKWPRSLLSWKLWNILRGTDGNDGIGLCGHWA